MEPIAHKYAHVHVSRLVKKYSDKSMQWEKSLRYLKFMCQFFSNSCNHHTYIYSCSHTQYFYMYMYLSHLVITSSLFHCLFLCLFPLLLLDPLVPFPVGQRFPHQPPGSGLNTAHLLASSLGLGRYLLHFTLTQ